MSEAVEGAGAPRIVLTGATGRTGNAIAHALATRDDVELVAVVAPSVAGTPTRPLPEGVAAFASLADALAAAVAPSVLLDITHAEPALEHLALAVDAGLHAVVGATGFEPGQLDEVGARFDAAGLGLLVVPNFSVGAVLGMRYAAELARHFADVEIVETHHDGKRDSPSGTAVRTAQLVAEARREAGLAPGPGAATAGTQASRGETIEGVPVHALRLPGAVAHQEVVFGAPGELLTIRHDALDRGCYAHGAALATRRVHEFRGLNTGLELVL